MKSYRPTTRKEVMMGSNITKAQMREAWGKGISLGDYEMMRGISAVSHQEILEFFDRRYGLTDEKLKSFPTPAHYVALRQHKVTVRQFTQILQAGIPAYTYLDAIKAGLSHKEIMEVVFAQYDLEKYVQGLAAGLSKKHMIEVMKLCPRFRMSYGMEMAIKAGLEHQNLIDLLKMGFNDFDFRNYVELHELGVSYDRVVEVFEANYRLPDHQKGLAEYTKGAKMGLDHNKIIAELKKRAVVEQ